MLQRLKKEMHELRNPAGHEFFARADHLLERNRSGLRPTVAEQLAQLVPASEKGVRERERAFGWIWETSLSCTVLRGGDVDDGADDWREASSS